MENDYKVGYGKPPKSGQFKPGQSGNSKGRPKGKAKPDFFDLFEKELQSHVTLTNGSKITKESAVIKQICNKASGGDYKSGKLILDIKSKQQRNALGKHFLDKLIKEGYITENKASDYIGTTRNLSLNELPYAVYSLYKFSNVKRSVAFEAVKHVLFLSGVWNDFLTLVSAIIIFDKICSEYNFWDGVDAALNCANIDAEQKKHIIADLEHSRKCSRPSEDLYNTAIYIYYAIQINISEKLTKFRDTVTAFSDYKEQEENWFSDKNQQSMFSMAKEEMTEAEYEYFKKELEEYQKAYKLFLPAKDLSKTKEFAALKAQITREKLQNLSAWTATIQE